MKGSVAPTGPPTVSAEDLDVLLQYVGSMYSMGGRRNGRAVIAAACNRLAAAVKVANELRVSSCSHPHVIRLADPMPIFGRAFMGPQTSGGEWRCLVCGEWLGNGSRSYRVGAPGESFVLGRFDR